MQPRTLARIQPFLLCYSLLACGKLVDAMPHEETSSDVPTDSRAGSGSATHLADASSTDVEAIAGGSGGVSGGETVPVLYDAGIAVDASAPPGPAADGGAADAGKMSTELLCDGSSGMRLVFELSGGFVQTTYGFTNPHGHASFAIDGTCRFYAGKDYMHPISTGTLTEAEAVQLSKDVHWFEPADWDWNIRLDQNCADGGGATLTRAGIEAGCMCGCDDAAPHGLGQALSSAYEWVERLMAVGTPVRGPVSAIAIKIEVDDGIRNLPIPEWPFTRKLNSIPGLVYDLSVGGVGSNVAHFDDPDEAMKLRDWRDDELSYDAKADVRDDHVRVKEGDTLYFLYVRDDLPADADKAWNALLATLPPLE